MIRLVALLLLGCGGEESIPPSDKVHTLGLPVSLDCTHGEVACGARLAYGPERCFLYCASGEWQYLECFPVCGESRSLTGVNDTRCEMPRTGC